MIFLSAARAPSADLDIVGEITFIYSRRALPMMSPHFALNEGWVSGCPPKTTKTERKCYRKKLGNQIFFQPSYARGVCSVRGNYCKKCFCLRTLSIWFPPNMDFKYIHTWHIFPPKVHRFFKMIDMQKNSWYENILMLNQDDWHAKEILGMRKYFFSICGKSMIRLVDLIVTWWMR